MSSETLPPFPTTEQSPLFRTAFGAGTDAQWASLLTALQVPSEEGFLPYITPVDDEGFSLATPQDLFDAARAAKANFAVIFVADARALAEEGFPVIAVDISGLVEYDEHFNPLPLPVGTKARTFRCVAAELWSPENNLNIANMDWEDFADALDGGVFRGFPDWRQGEDGEEAAVQQGEEAPRMQLASLERPA